MARFLMEEEGWDVNQLDCDEPMSNHWGTAVGYAATGENDTDFIRYLPDKAADPRIKDFWGGKDALRLAAVRK